MPQPTRPRAAPPLLGDGGACAICPVALFLDVDGVLLAFADTPDGVVVPAALVARLAALHAALDGALALVSGRRIATLDTLFAPLRLPCAGLHGFEQRQSDGSVQACIASAASPTALARLREAAWQIAAQHPGALVEDKGAALALHWRAAPLAAHAFNALATAAAADLPGYHLQPGDCVVEIKPQGADKGAAIDAFMAKPPFAGRTPVFVGDDLTDEHGFARVNRLGGVSVLVGGRTTSAAHYALRDVDAVHAWLGVAHTAPAAAA